MTYRRNPNRRRPCPMAPRPRGSVVCLLCGVRKKALNGHLFHKHRVSAVEYRRMFPGVMTECAESHERHRKDAEAMNDQIRRRGFVHRTQRRFWRRPGSEPRSSTNTDTGTAPVSHGENRVGSKGAAP